MVFSHWDSQFMDHDHDTHILETDGISYRKFQSTVTLIDVHDQPPPTNESFPPLFPPDFPLNPWWHMTAKTPCGTLQLDLKERGKQYRLAPKKNENQPRMAHTYHTSTVTCLKWYEKSNHAITYHTIWNLCNGGPTLRSQWRGYPTGSLGDPTQLLSTQGGMPKIWPSDLMEHHQIFFWETMGNHGDDPLPRLPG